MNVSQKPVAATFQHLETTCTSSYLYLNGFPYEYPAQDGQKGYDPEPEMDRFFASTQWVNRPGNKTVLAMCPLVDYWEKRISRLKREGFVLIHQYRTDYMHIYKNERYMVGIFFLDSPDNLKEENRKKKEPRN